MEIVKLDLLSANCPNYPSFPNSDLKGLAGMLDHQDEPLICGGCNDQFCSNFCYKLNGSTWTSSNTFSMAKMYMPIIKAPFKNASRLFMMSGGYFSGTSVNTVEILTTNGWEIFTPSLPSAFHGHCMVSLPTFAAMQIGGTAGATIVGVTYIITNDKPVWTKGPILNFARQYHACSRITNNDWTPKYSTIVVGGINGAVLNTVEILDDESTSWRIGPPLPISVFGFSMVEDQRGGVISLGGYLSGAQPTNLMYRLRNSESTSWELMPHKLASPRAFFTAIMIPDFKVNCTYV